MKGFHFAIMIFTLEHANPTTHTHSLLVSEYEHFYAALINQSFQSRKYKFVMKFNRKLPCTHVLCTATTSSAF